jgi:hypothetical protein
VRKDGALSVSYKGQTRNDKTNKVGAMADLLNLAMLICASGGSMAFGILAAYGILRAGFALMRPRSRKPVVASQLSVIGGQ